LTIDSSPDKTPPNHGEIFWTKINLNALEKQHRKQRRMTSIGNAVNPLMNGAESFEFTETNSGDGPKE